jgi:hypothetical protein
MEAAAFAQSNKNKFKQKLGQKQKLAVKEPPVKIEASL